MAEVYHSTTHGPIPLSFTGRRLLANLREAINEYTRQISCHGYKEEFWKPVAHARGELAKYMSELERGQRHPNPDIKKAIDEGTHPFLRPVTPTVHIAPSGNTFVLPKIPKGYALRIVGNLVSIEPVKDGQA